jgi:crossover junction endodeoxyribonuclease RuvC
MLLDSTRQVALNQHEICIAVCRYTLTPHFVDAKSRLVLRCSDLILSRQLVLISNPPLLSNMRILGIDPGLRTTGFGVIDAQGARLSYVASGTIQTSADQQKSLPLRLKTIFDGVREVAKTYQPHCAAIEIVFVNINPQSTLLLGQARGAALTALVFGDLPVTEYTALQLKKAVAGHGKAHKEQVQHMVQRLLDLPGLPGKDAADALGLAITHAHSSASRLSSAAAHSAAAESEAMGYRDGRWR